VDSPKAVYDHEHVNVHERINADVYVDVLVDMDVDGFWKQ
jgi:hypothetical protein